MGQTSKGDRHTHVSCAREHAIIHLTCKSGRIASLSISLRVINLRPPLVIRPRVTDEETLIHVTIKKVVLNVHTRRKQRRWGPFLSGARPGKRGDKFCCAKRD